MSGKWVEAASGKTFPVLNPANGEIIAEVRLLSFTHLKNIFRTQVPDMGVSDTEAAIEAAHKAQRHWASLPCKVGE